MYKREETVRRWFSMWLAAEDTGIADIFTGDAVYIESWGPAYHGLEKIQHWFTEWNTRGRVLQWDIQQFFHSGGQTVVVWSFQNRMKDGTVEAFDGMSLIGWSPEGKIARLQEFGCNQNRYDPYAQGDTPRFRDGQALWF